MKEKEPHQADSHLHAPSEANREKHINFPEVEEESTENFEIDKSTSDRQEQWRKEIKEGKEEKRRSNAQRNNSTMPVDEDDTTGDT